MGNKRFKVGDRVRIKSLDWYNRYTNGTEVDCGAYPFTSDMKEFCGQERIIANVCQECYLLLGIDDRFVWTDEMIEGLVEEEIDLIPKFGEYSDNEPLDIPTMTTDFIKEHGLPCPEGYIFRDENGNVINATKIVLEKKKKEYPKNYNECLKIIGIKFSDCYIQGYKSPLLEDLQELLICRDAYWKIAGEEMGLGKPWEPDWNTSEPKYVISCTSNGIEKQWETTYCKVLAFPTEEMRDAFYENFKELIEQCKELL